MKIYLAARYSRYPEMQQVRTQLEDMGHIVTSRWINGEHQMKDREGSSQVQDEERMRFGREDVEDLLAADCVINFTEKPRSNTNSRGGRYVEFGIAYNAGKRLLVVGWRENVFHYLPGVLFFPTWEEALGALR